MISIADSGESSERAQELREPLRKSHCPDTFGAGINLSEDFPLPETFLPSSVVHQAQVDEPGMQGHQALAGTCLKLLIGGADARPCGHENARDAFDQADIREDGSSSVASKLNPASRLARSNIASSSASAMGSRRWAIR
jgi:hypothetical protein